MILLDTLKNKKHPTFQVIKSALEEKGYDISPRTLQRVIEEIRYEFKIDIIYDNKIKGYYIDYENSPGYNKLLKLAQLNERSLMIQTVFNKNNSSLQKISFEFEGDFPNIDKTPYLLKAITENRVIEINHFRFDKHQKYWLKVKPYLLKEYNNRFYLIAQNSKGVTKSYGLDRIAEIKITDETFKPEKNYNPQQFYSNVIGVYYDHTQQPFEEVVLSLNPLGAQYARSLKWHHSQEIEENGNEVILKLYVHINFELIQKILAQGSWVKVLQPKSLVERIKNELKSTLNSYH